jgi:hypothetical protein
MYLSASLAHVRLFTGMNAHMHSQRGSLNELLAAVRVVTNVRPNTAVNSL